MRTLCPRYPRPIGFLPLIRSGDLLFNAIVLHHRLVCGIGRLDSIVDVRRTASQCFCVAGPHPARFARTVFGIEGHELEMLQQHTLVGVYARAMTPVATAEWVRRLKDKRRRNTLRPLGLRTGNWTEVCSESLRSCRRCVESDTQSQGFAAWRVLHQVPALDRCPIHGDPLVAELNPMTNAHGVRRLWPLSFPVGAASAGLRSAIPISEGYAEYLTRWPQLFRGDLPGLRADQWALLVKTIIDQSGELPSATLLLERQIVRAWDMPLATLARAISAAGGDAFVAEELSLRTQPKDVARRLVVWCAAHQLGLIGRPGDQPNLNYGSGDVGAVPRNESAEVQLRDAVVTRGFRIRLADALLQGESSGAASGIAGEQRSTVRRCVRGLPSDLLERLSASREWSARSWLMRELARRSR